MSSEFDRKGAPRRGNPSLFGPIVLIAIGAYFLLRNLGVLPDTLIWNWTAVFQLWPVWLIFLGVNVLVQQAPRPIGGFLSGVVGLSAVGFLGYVLFFSADNPLLARLGVQSEPETKMETISFAPDDVSEARVEIDFGVPGAELFALDDSRSLIEGEVSYFGNLTFDTSQTGSSATVKLKTNDASGWLWFTNPANWGSGGLEKWRIGLHPAVALDLNLNVGAGGVNLDLEDLKLSNLVLKGGAGRTTLTLPGGDYDAELDASAGSMEIWLGGNGRQRIDVDGSAGSMTFYLPESMEARVSVNGGPGSFNVENPRFTQVSEGKRNSGVWETAAYRAGTDNSIELLIDMSAGSVRLRSK